MNSARIEIAAKGYEARSDEIAAQLAVFKPLWSLQQTIEEGAAAYAVPSAGELETWLSSGTPVLSQAPADIEAAALTQAALDVASCLAENAGLPDENAAALKDVDWEAIVEAAPIGLAGSEPSAYLNAALEKAGDVPLAGVVLSAALKPLLEGASSAIVDAVKKDKLSYLQGSEGFPSRCPVCGCEATLAYVGPNESSQGNGRLLWCGQCGADWPYERVRCTHCGTKNQGHLHYLSQEGDPLHRLHVCEECGGTIRSRFVEDNDLAIVAYEVEDVVMATLSEAAAHE